MLFRSLLVVGGNHIEIDSGGTITVTAESELVLQCGSAKIGLKSDGSIAIEGSSKIELVSGGTSVKADPSAYKVTGTQVDLSGSAQVNVTGGLVKIN